MGVLTIADIKCILSSASIDDFPKIEEQFAGDDRAGVRRLLQAARDRIASEQAEADRLECLYELDSRLSSEHEASIVVGLDEVGRGCMAGPLAVGAVVLDASHRIPGLNDSKQVRPESRESISEMIEDSSIAWSVRFVEPGAIDRDGLTRSLANAFRLAVQDIEDKGIEVDLILLDGNPLRFDERELNIIKGDSKSASIAAASIIAKVTRDRLMVEMASKYPGYHFEKNKGYGTLEHRRAIAEHGLCDIHRLSFCGEFLQDPLF